MKNLILFTFALFLGFSSWAKRDEFTKEFSKNFVVNPDVNLKTRSSFGTLNITHWDQNEVQIDIEVNIEAKNDSEAEKIFDQIEVTIVGDEYRVSVETEREGSYSGNAEVDINITIKAPENARLDVKHDFGHAHIGKFGNEAEIQSSFGSLEVEELRHRDCSVSSEYGEVNIERFGGGELEVQFGSMTVDRIEYNTEIQASYSSAEFKGVQPSVEELELDNEFGSVELNIHRDCNFHVEAHASFGDVELPNDIKNRSKDSDMTSFEVSGDIGNGKGDLDINSSFGDVEVDFD